ncbi:MAG: FtsH protease activity modulator HflK [bacterium]|nr:FtsH protease activity modulator HflK [bacterium]
MRQPFNISNARQLVIPRIPLGVLMLVPAILVLLVVVFSAFYTVDPEEVGVVLRLGKYHVTAQPGLHFKLPLGIDRVTYVPILRQEKEEFGFRTHETGVRTEYVDPGEKPELLLESLMVTGDLNSAMVEWIVQYRIKEPRDFLFNVMDPVETLRYVSESVMREVVGDHTVDEVLTVGRTQIATMVEQKLQQVVNEYKVGIQIERVVLQDVNPPDPVKASFNDVNQAQQERERMINEARSEYNKVVPRAKGEAEQTISEAEGYAIRRVNEAEGDATRFNAILAEYLKAPDVTRRRLYLETMGEVIPRLGHKYIIDENSRGVLPLMQLEPPAKEAAK